MNYEQRIMTYWLFSSITFAVGVVTAVVDGLLFLAGLQTADAVFDIAIRFLLVSLVFSLMRWIDQTHRYLGIREWVLTNYHGTGWCPRCNVFHYDGGASR